MSIGRREVRKSEIQHAEVYSLIYPVPGLDHCYVSEDGEVYSDNPKNRWRGKLVKIMQFDNGRGYMRVRSNGACHCVHLLVARTFLGPKPEGLEVNHIDGDKSNNRPENLEYVSRSQNMKHCHDMGLTNHPAGERHHNSKMDENSVVEMRKEYGELRKEGRLPNGSMKYLVAKYGVSETTITKICRGNGWACVK